MMQGGSRAREQRRRHFDQHEGDLLRNPSPLEATVLFYRPRSRRLMTRNGGRTTTGETKEEREGARENEGGRGRLDAM